MIRNQISSNNYSEVEDRVNSESKVLGESVKGDWDHMSVELPSEMIHESKLINASQAMAEKLEDFRILMAALLEYPSKSATLEYASKWDTTFRVTTNAGTGIYKLDRWD